jgi:PQQ-like domain/Tyrosine-protein kinase ephrin type A/B receptor-like
MLVIFFFHIFILLLELKLLTAQALWPSSFYYPAGFATGTDVKSTVSYDSSNSGYTANLLGPQNTVGSVWSFYMGENIQNNAILLSDVASNLIVVVDGNNNVYGVDAIAGTLRWSYSAPLAINLRPFATSSSYNLVILGMANSPSVEGCVMTSPYVSAIVALNISNGNTVWTYAYPATVSFNNGGGIVMYSCIEGPVFLDEKEGIIIAQTLEYVGSPSAIVAISLLTGIQKYKTIMTKQTTNALSYLMPRAALDINSNIIVSAADFILSLGSSTYFTDALNVSLSGAAQKLWETRYGNDLGGSKDYNAAMIAVPTRNIIVICYRYTATTLVAIDSVSGSVLWSNPSACAANALASSVSLVFSSVQFDNNGQTLVYISAYNMSGGIMWNSPIFSSYITALIADNTSVYVASGSTLYRLSSTTGALQWRITPSSTMIYTIAIGLNNMIYVGSDKLYAFQPCSSGLFGTSIGFGATSGCSACNAGWFSSKDDAIMCQPCPPGFFTLAQASTFCSPCSLGSYTATSSSKSCTLCPAGTFGTVQGAVNVSACQPCVAGTYNPIPGQSQSNCIFCPAGTASAVVGASTPSTCVTCAPGQYALAGSPQCLPCPAGTYSIGYGSSSCSQCPLGTFSAAVGATIASTCTKCSSGYTTVTLGAISESSCIAGVTGCGSLGQQRDIISGNCVPLLCKAPALILDNVSMTCLGCNSGSAGSVGNCTTCADAARCPGFLLLPLPSDLSNISSYVPLYPRATATTSSANASTLLPTSIVIIIGVAATLAMIILLLYAIGTHIPFCSSIRQILRTADIFGVFTLAEVGKLPKRSTTMGGAFSLLGIVIFSATAAILAAQRAQNNILATSSFTVLDSLAQAQAIASVPASPASSGITLKSGITIRVLAQADTTGTCANILSWQNTSLFSGDFTLVSSALAGNVASHVFSCRACLFTASSMLSLYLPFSCQALLIEAAAVDAAGNTASLRFSSPIPPTAFLNSVTWQLAPLLNVQIDTTAGGISTRGFQLVEQTSSITASNMVSLLPASASILITIYFANQPFFSLTTLSERQSLLSLISSIIGLAGIFSGVGIAFQTVYWLRRGKNQNNSELINTATPDQEKSAIVNPMLKLQMASSKRLVSTNTLRRRQVVVPSVIDKVPFTDSEAPGLGWEIRWSKTKNAPYYENKESGKVTWNIEDTVATPEVNVNVIGTIDNKNEKTEYDTDDVVEEEYTKEEVFQDNNYHFHSEENTHDVLDEDITNDATVGNSIDYVENTFNASVVHYTEDNHTHTNDHHHQT